MYFNENELIWLSKLIEQVKDFIKEQPEPFQEWLIASAYAVKVL